jgi:hypothetical protein
LGDVRIGKRRYQHTFRYHQHQLLDLHRRDELQQRKQHSRLYAGSILCGWEWAGAGREQYYQ